MFKITLVCLFATLLACTHADNIDKDATIIDDNRQEPDALGNFQYAFRTSNGIENQEAGNENGVTGEVSYTSPEGIPIRWSYRADDNGYQPYGDILPTPPPIPPAIIRLLEYLAAHPPAQEQRR